MNATSFHLSLNVAFKFNKTSKFIIKQGRKRPLDTPKRMIEREKERKKGRRRDIEREGEIRERDR